MMGALIVKELCLLIEHALLTNIIPKLLIFFINLDTSPLCKKRYPHINLSKTFSDILNTNTT